MSAMVCPGGMSRRRFSRQTVKPAAAKGRSRRVLARAQSIRMMPGPPGRKSIVRGPLPTASYSMPLEKVPVRTSGLDARVFRHTATPPRTAPAAAAMIRAIRRARISRSLRSTWRGRGSRHALGGLVAVVPPNPARQRYARDRGITVERSDLVTAWVTGIVGQEGHGERGCSGFEFGLHRGQVARRHGQVPGTTEAAAGSKVQPSAEAIA